MDKDLQTILETQMKFQKAVTENIEVATKNIQALNERVKLTHNRMDLQGVYGCSTGHVQADAGRKQTVKAQDRCFTGMEISKGGNITLASGNP